MVGRDLLWLEAWPQVVSSVSEVPALTEAGDSMSDKEIRFERGVFEHYPDLRRRLSHPGEPCGIWYLAKVYPSRFEPRKVEALVPFGSEEPWIYVDGPMLSPHRYNVKNKGRIRLCMWYPNDPPSQKWSVKDGLLALFGLIRTHLIREGYYREDIEQNGSAKWLGPEAPHG